MKLAKKILIPKMEKRDKFEKELERIKSSFRLEGQSLSDDTLNKCRLVLERKVTVEEAIAQVIRDR